MRLFVAVDLPPRLKDRLEHEVVEPLRPAVPGARWTRPEGRHLTLAFLGSVSEERVGGVKRALWAEARRHEPFELWLGSLGGFPSLRRPRVLWIGVEGGGERLEALAQGVGIALEPEGFERDARPFRAHLTLARLVTPVPLDLSAPHIPDEHFECRQIVLYRSHLERGGARYEARGRFTLGRAS